MNDTQTEQPQPRVIVVSGDFPPRHSGVGDYACHLSRAIQKTGRPLHVLTTVTQEPPEEWSGMDVRAVMDGWSWGEIRHLLNLIREAPGETVVNIQYHCPMTYGRRLLVNFIPLLLRIFSPGTRCVVTMHGFWEQSRLFQRRTIPMLRWAHGIVYVDSVNRPLLSRYSGLPGERLKHVPIGGNIVPVACDDNLRASWRHELDLKENETAIAFFGGIAEHKGVHYLVEAVSLLQQRRPGSVVLLLIGGFNNDGTNDLFQAEMKERIRTLGIERQVRAIEPPPPEKVSRCLFAADLAVYPFVNGVGENSGSMLAALAHGLPTIITSGPANNPDFASRLGVAMVPPRSAAALADEIESLLGDADRRRELKAASLITTRRLNWDYIAQEYLRFFDSLLVEGEAGRLPVSAAGVERLPVTPLHASGAHEPLRVEVANSPVPLFSVVIPLYNKAAEVERSVRSVLAQTVGDFEVVVVDDGSTDHSKDLVERIQDPRIRVLSQPHAGVSMARNRGIVEAKSDMIAFLDADDEWQPEFLETIVRLTTSFPECHIFATSYFYATPDGRVRAAVPKGIPPHPWEGVKDFCISYDQDPPFNMSCLAVRKRALEAIGGFPVGVSVGEDLLVKMQLLLRFDLAYSTFPCAVYWTPGGMRPGRMPSYPDLVGDRLEALRGTCPDWKTPELENFIERWYRGRCIANLSGGRSWRAREELRKVAGMGGWHGELYLLFFMSLLPKPLPGEAVKALAKLKGYRRRLPF